MTTITTRMPAASYTTSRDLLGSLLIVETTARLSARRMAAATASMDRSSRAVLVAWARAREGRAIPRLVYGTLGVPIADRLELLDGCVEALHFTLPP